MLRTRSPLGRPEQAPWTSFDLHVLSTPPAFILSQDQTLQQERGRSRDRRSEHRTSDECQRAHRPSWESSCGRCVLAVWSPHGTNRELTGNHGCCRQGRRQQKLTDSSPTTRGWRRTARTGVLSSLPFSRSRSSGTHRQRGWGSEWVSVVRRWCREAFPEGKTFREAELEDSSCGCRCNTPQEIISRRWCDFFPLRSSRYLPWTRAWPLSWAFSSSWIPFT